MHAELTTSSFDCKVRELAWEYGKGLAPHRGGFKSLFDALQLSNCGLVDAPTIDDVWKQPDLEPPSPDDVVIYADAEHGNDDLATRDGRSPQAPLRTLEAAVRESRKIVASISPGTEPPQRHIVLTGRHHIAETLQLSSADSGLHIRNGGVGTAPAELTGAKRLTGLVWERYTPKPPKPAPPTPASFIPNENNVYGVAVAGKDSPGIKCVPLFVFKRS